MKSNISFEVEMHSFLQEFTIYVMSKAGLLNERWKVIDYDLGRIYLAVNGEENNYTIRLWEVRENYILYSLFENIELSAVELIQGQEYTGL